MRTISFGANVEDNYSSFLVKHDRGIVGRTKVKSIKLGDKVFSRYNGVGEIVKETQDCWYILFEENKLRLMSKWGALEHLYEV